MAQDLQIKIKTLKGLLIIKIIMCLIVALISLLNISNMFIRQFLIYLTISSRNVRIFDEYYIPDLVFSIRYFKNTLDC